MSYCGNYLEGDRRRLTDAERAARRARRKAAKAAKRRNR